MDSSKQTFDAALDAPLGSVAAALRDIERHVNSQYSDQCQDRDSVKAYYLQCPADRDASHVEHRSPFDPFKGAYHQECDCDVSYSTCQHQVAFRRMLIEVNEFCKESSAVGVYDGAELAAALHALAAALAPFVHVDDGGCALDALLDDANDELTHDAVEVSDHLAILRRG